MPSKQKKKGKKATQKPKRKRKTKKKTKKKFPPWLTKYYALRQQGKSKKAAYKEAGAPEQYYK